jgi:hypothetical protein
MERVASGRGATNGKIALLSGENLPTAMPKCFVIRFESTVCHIELAGMKGMVKATPWVQDRQIMRPILDTTHHQPEFLAHAEDAAVLAVIEFLERRFGSTAVPPRPCQAQEHRQARALPLVWTNEPVPARHQRPGHTWTRPKEG